MTHPVARHVRPPGDKLPNANGHGEQSRTSADLSREEWRDLIWPEDKTENKRKAYDPRFIRLFGSSAGLLLSQLVFWSEKGWDPEGWIYKSAPEIEAEVGLTERKTETARERLVKEGVIAVKLQSPRDHQGRVLHPSRVYHYLVDLEALAIRLGIKTPILNHDSELSEMLGSNLTECEVQTVQSIESVSNTLSGSYTESTSRDNVRVRPTESSSLQEGAEPAFAEPAPLPQDIEVENNIDAPELLGGDERHRHPRVGDTRHETTPATEEGMLALSPPPSPELTPIEVNEMLSAIFARHTDTGCTALAYVERGEHSLELIADALCKQLQKPKDYAERYLRRLPEALEMLRLEGEAVASLSWWEERGG